MSTLHITRGLPASGKTTWAVAWVTGEPNRYRVNRDSLRSMVLGITGKALLTYEQEKAVTDAARAAVLALLTHGDVVTDDMNLRPKYVREWQRFTRANGHKFEVHEFPVEVDEAVRRDDEDRPTHESVGESVIRSIAARYTRNGVLQPIPDDSAEQTPQPYVRPEGAPPAIMVDIDGTLALMGDRSPYDLTLVCNDKTNWPVVEAVQAAAADGLTVIYCSGREDSCRADTQAWLDANVAIPGPLLMRAADDKRKDSIVKRELFDEHIRDQYDVRYVLDDRQQVVDMWRSLGLTVFQVAKGDF